MEMLELNNLHKTFNPGTVNEKVALNGVSLHMEAGDFATIVGSNGAGKSSMMNAISGIVKYKSGEILYKGQPLPTAANKVVRLGVCQVPEGRLIFANLTVYENLKVGAYLRSDKDGIERDLKRVYEIFPRLEERKNQIAGTLSGSIAITADAFNNLSDAGASVVTLLGFRIAAKTPDPGHPFGHGRAEYLSGLAVSMLILLMGVELGKSSVEKILHPEAVDFSPVSVAILAASILVKLWMGHFNRTLGKKLGSAAMAGCGAYSKIEGFAFLPVSCFSMALATFVSQNIGARRYDRVRSGIRFGLLCSPLLAEAIGLGIFVLSPLLVAAFNSSPEVIAYGVADARTVSLFYFLLAFSHCCAGILRGTGRPIIPMAIMLATWCALRIAYITAVTHFIPDIRVIYWAYPLTWFLGGLLFAVCLLRLRFPSDAALETYK